MKSTQRQFHMLSENNSGNSSNACDPCSFFQYRLQLHGGVLTSGYKQTYFSTALGEAAIFVRAGMCAVMAFKQNQACSAKRASKRSASSSADQSPAQRGGRAFRNIQTAYPIPEIPALLMKIETAREAMSALFERAVSCRVCLTETEASRANGENAILR